MPASEQQLALITDVTVSRDSQMRYDIYFTDKRIVIIYVGTKPSSTFGYSGLVGGLIAEGVNVVDRKLKNDKMKKNEELMANLSIDELLNMDEKNCFWTYDEIEEVHLEEKKFNKYNGQYKFIISNAECESEFSPTQGQFNKINNILSGLGVLKGKIKIELAD